MYYYLYFVLIFIIIFSIYFPLYRNRDKGHDEDEAFNKLVTADGILNYLEKLDLDVSKYRNELKNCKELYDKKDFIGSKYCSDSVLSEMRSLDISMRLTPQENNYKVCRKCGEKIYGNFIFCPKCGEPL